MNSVVEQAAVRDFLRGFVSRTQGCLCSAHHPLELMPACPVRNVVRFSYERLVHPRIPTATPVENDEDMQYLYAFHEHLEHPTVLGAWPRA